MNTRRHTLDLDTEAMRELSACITELATDCIMYAGEMPVFPAVTAGELASDLGGGLPHDGSPIQEIVADCRRVIHASRNNGHPRLFGYVMSPASPVGAFADLLASAMNQNMPAWRSAPGATTVEQTAVRWLGELTGFSESAGGFLTSGGSIANLNALWIAHRAKFGAEASLAGIAATGTATAYASDQVHMSIPKAADVLGLGRANLIHVPSNTSFQIDTAELCAAIRADIARGRKPFCVVGNAGTVGTGAVDPLGEIAEIAKDFALWFHIDGAYGAPAAAVPSKGELFRGIERADSMSVDAHKWLYAPVDCGCLLLRDMDAARAAVGAVDDNYVKVFEQAAEAFAFWDYSIELSRRFRALKLWMMLRYYGAGRIARAIEEDIELAGYMAGRIEEEEDFELLAPPVLSICCFRYVPLALRKELAAASPGERELIEPRIDRLNEQVMHAVQRGGQAYVSNAAVRGRFALRACITNFRTTRDDVDATLAIIREMALGLAGRPAGN